MKSLREKDSLYNLEEKSIMENGKMDKLPDKEHLSNLKKD
jgi:hypothetical protein